VDEETTKQLFDLFVAESREREGGEGAEEVREVELPVMMGRTLKVVARGRSCFVTFPGESSQSVSIRRHITMMLLCCLSGCELLRAVL
jgi:hypothetical protein